MSGTSSPGLKPTLGLAALTVYGIGDILGAGIYSVVGDVAAAAGFATWLSFLAAMFVAFLTALSYAELGGRFSRSGGASFFCQEAFRRRDIPLLIGWLVLCSGLVSMATGVHGFAKWLIAIWPELNAWNLFEGWNIWPVALGFLLLLAIINFSGMQLSSLANVICTTLELSGLLIVIGAGLAFIFSDGVRPDVPVDQDVVASFNAILTGAALAFFSFIGFEDLVNVSEEVKDPHRNVPIAIIASLTIAGAIYLCVIVVSLQVVNPAEKLQGPLLFEVVKRGAPMLPGNVLAVIALFAISNTALLNYIMGSRLLYGMSRQRLLPSFLGKVHATRRTPVAAILVVFVIALILAITGSLKSLAGTTSLLLLTVFTCVHVSLIIIKRRDGTATSGFRVSIWVPVLGICTTLGLMGFSSLDSLIKYAIIMAIGLVIILMHYIFGRVDDRSLPELKPVG